MTHHHDPIDSFAERIQLDEETGCWNWTGHVSKKGYAKFWAGSHIEAYHFAYLYFVGPVPDGRELHHKCRNRRCANPWHVEPRTHAEHCAIDFAKTHCPKGHEYTDENSYFIKGGHGTVSRACKICAKARAKARFREKHDLMRAQAKQYYQTNKVRLLAQMKARYQRLKEIAAATKVTAAKSS